jgi:hypothetical protein
MEHLPLAALILVVVIWIVLPAWKRWKDRRDDEG